MKQNLLYLILLILLVSSANCHAQEQDFTTRTGPYLGQKPPGMTPERFAPEIFSKVQPEVSKADRILSKIWA